MNVSFYFLAILCLSFSAWAYVTEVKNAEGSSEQPKVLVRKMRTGFDLAALKFNVGRERQLDLVIEDQQLSEEERLDEMSDDDDDDDSPEVLVKSMDGKRRKVAEKKFKRDQQNQILQNPYQYRRLTPSPNYQNRNRVATPSLSYASSPIQAYPTLNPSKFPISSPPASYSRPYTKEIPPTPSPVYTKPESSGFKVYTKSSSSYSTPLSTSSKSGFVYSKPPTSDSPVRTTTKRPNSIYSKSYIKDKAKSEKNIPKFIDFSGAQIDPETGKLCVIKRGTVPSIRKDPLLECTQRNVRVCHFTYVTRYIPNREEVCEENFEKICQITFNKMAFNETIRKCYKSMEKECKDDSQYPTPLYSSSPSTSYGVNSVQGEEICQKFYETVCSTRYIEKRPGQQVGDTRCKKIPRKLCGNSNCKIVDKPEQCHNQVVATVVDIPEETCDLNPQKTCRFQTRLAPQLTPVEECTLQPRQVCQLGFQDPKSVTKPLTIKWCLKEDVVAKPVYYQPSSSSYGSPQQVSAQNSYGVPASNPIGANYGSP